MFRHRKYVTERITLKGMWTCWRRGYHIDGTAEGNWTKDWYCKDCGDLRFLNPGFLDLGRHNRPWADNRERRT